LKRDREATLYGQRWLLHLKGGIRATTVPGPNLVVQPSSTAGAIRFKLKQIPDLFVDLSDAGLDPLGIEFIHDSDQQAGLYPPIWQPVYSHSRPVDDCVALWRALANGGTQTDNYELFALTARIAFGFQAASLRLRDLSRAYNRELDTLVSKGSFTAGTRGKSLNTFQIFLEIHSFFSEAASLRDHLAEFIGRYVLKDHVPDVTTRIRLMASLVKHVLKPARGKNSIADELHHATREPEGWLATFSAYRDLFIHYLPASQAAPGGFIWRSSYSIANGDALPRITVPLPADPFSLKRILSTDNHFKTMAEYFSSIKDSREPASTVDALDYCHAALENFVNLATVVAPHSPAPPHAVHIDARDLIGPIILTGPR
jgi:hypothetical protein